MSDPQSATKAVARQSQRSLQRKSLLSLFESGDKDKNGKLDPYELHSFLISRGVMVPLNITLSLISAADLDGDGCLTSEEFFCYLLQDESEKSSRRRRLNFIQSLIYDIDFWFKICLTLGGILFAVPAFPDELSLTDLQVANIFMVGLFCYIACSFKYFIPLPMNMYKAKLSEEKSARSVQMTIRQHASTFFSEMITEKEPESPKGSSLIQRHLDEKSPGTSESAQLRIYIDEVIFGGDKHLRNMTKVDLELYLLKSKQTTLSTDAIFQFVDKDKNGTITREELQTFVEDANLRKSLLERLYVVMKACFMNLSWVFGIVFCSGSVIAVAQNILIRFENTKEGLWVNEDFTVTHAAAYLYNIGCLVFVSEQFEVIRDKYDVEEKIREVLKRWIVESEEARTDEWVIFSNSDGLNRNSLNRLLEESAIFISRSHLDSIFMQIDSNANDLICLMELKEFVECERNRLRTIWAWCLKDIVFLTNFLWEIGCMLYLIAAYGIAVELFYKIGGVLFCVGGFNLLAQFIVRKKSDFQYMINLRSAILRLREKTKGLRSGVSTNARVLEEFDIEKNIDITSTMDRDFRLSMTSNDIDFQDDGMANSIDISLELFEG